MKEDIREQVRKKYARVITSKSGCGCSSGCCGDSRSSDPVTGNLYNAAEIEGLPEDLIAKSLGCGNPTALGELYPGEIVLDLGSGAGLDVLLSARRVGPFGKAYGLDMTDEMLAEANANKAKSGLTNAAFLKGHIEDIPLSTSSVDVVISNCVINLSADKDQVFREIFRVLKPGGRVAVSDIVVTRPLPPGVVKDLLAWAGCVAGALTQDEYIIKLKQAGFEDVEIVVTRVYDLTDPLVQNIVPGASDEELQQMNGSLVSAFIRAKKPSKMLRPGKDFNIQLASQKDFDGIQDLLSRSGLPTAGVSPDTGNYYLAAANSLLGVLGVEFYGAAALLRSLAVEPEFRKAGVAQTLMQHVLQEIKVAGCTEVYLLTNSAEHYLAKFGFSMVERTQVPEVILASSALAYACPASSTCMAYSINDTDNSLQDMGV